MKQTDRRGLTVLTRLPPQTGPGPGNEGHCIRPLWEKCPKGQQDEPWCFHTGGATAGVLQVRCWRAVWRSTVSLKCVCVCLCCNTAICCFLQTNWGNLASSLKETVQLFWCGLYEAVCLVSVLAAVANCRLALCCKRYQQQHINNINHPPYASATLFKLLALYIAVRQPFRLGLPAIVRRNTDVLRFQECSPKENGYLVATQIWNM